MAVAESGRACSREREVAENFEVAVFLHGLGDERDAEPVRVLALVPVVRDAVPGR